jgi:23S rRNA (uracil1939-C5)-methyltransferase
MKSREYKVLENIAIESMSSDGRGVARLDGKVMFVDYALPGDVVDVQVRKEKKNFAEGVLLNLKQASSQRISPFCPHFGVCGGCTWQHAAYDEQLKYKHQIVFDAFTRLGKVEIPEVKPVIGSANNTYYRNKLEFTFTDRYWLTDAEVKEGIQIDDRRGLGFHVPGSFSGVLDVKHCYLQPDPSNAIRLAVKKFTAESGYTYFNLKSQEGMMRNLMIRTALTGELLVLVIFHENDEEKINALMAFLAHEFPQITSLQYIINTKRNDTYFDLENVVYKGKTYIIEQLGNYKFKIGAKSFFQTNPTQAKVLYDITKEFAELQPHHNVYDLYTGVGSIALYVSDLCKHVAGIEYVEAAIADAKENALLNNVSNCDFYAGDVRMILQKDFIEKNGKPEVVITDPPRAGMHEDVVKTLFELEAPKIVYVSCNAATQARDVQLLDEKYKVTKIQPVDMFPHTTHIENVVQLVLR